MNLATEHLMNPRLTKERYGGTAKYDETIAAIETALNAKVEQSVRRRPTRHHQAARRAATDPLARAPCSDFLGVVFRLWQVSSGLVSYSGFPANMGEAGVKMTLEAIGALKVFEYEPNDDGMTCSGRAEFDGPEQAKACIDKYDGMDMGLGTKLEIEAL